MRIIKLEEDMSKFKPENAEISAENIRAFVNAYKAGTIKPGVPGVGGLLSEEAMRVVEATCRERGCRLAKIADRFGADLSAYPRSNLSGAYQGINAALALTAVEVLVQDGKVDLDLERSRQSLLAVHWPGRWEERRLSSRKLVFDVSHNSEGAIWLERNLEQLAREEGRPDVIMGVMGAYRASALVPVAARWARSLTFVQPEQARACSIEELTRFVPASFAGEVRESSVAALFPAKGVFEMDTDATNPVVVTGSIYLIGEIWERYLEDEPLGQGKLQDF